MSHYTTGASQQCPQLEPLEPRILLSSYPLIPDGFLDVGNRWDYTAHASVIDHTPVSIDTTMSWQVTREEKVAGYNTRRLEQTTGLGYFQDTNAYLTSDHFVLVKDHGTIDHETLTVVNANPLELIPRTIRDTDSNAYVGAGDFRGKEMGHSGTWYETDTSYVTYQGHESLDLVVNGSHQTFDCVKLTTHLDWEDDQGWSGYDERTWWFDYDVGVVKAHVVAYDYGIEYEYDLTLESYSLACVDLVADVGAKLKLPHSVVAGSGTKITLPIEVRNEGNVPIAKGQRIDIALSARPVDAQGNPTGEPDIAIEPQQIEGWSVSGLKPGGMKKRNARVTLPTTLTEGWYCLVAHADAGDDVGEKHEDNNQAVMGSIEVAEGYHDLTAALGSKLKLPHSVVAGSGTKITLPIEVRNEGNVPIAKGQRIDIALSARPVDAQGNPTGGPDIPIEPQQIEGWSVSSLKPDRMKKRNARVTLPATLTEGWYCLVVHADSGDDVAEKYEDNNEVLTDPIEVT